jgi:hypothetical protein
VNALLSINRLGRGNGALFLVLPTALGTQISIVTHLVLPSPPPCGTTA